MSDIASTKAPLTAVVLVILIALAISSCGSAARTPTASQPKRSIATRHAQAASAPRHGSTKKFLNDGDHEREQDGGNSAYHDIDDRDALTYGHAATGQQESAISQTVESYYRLAAKAGATRACTMLDPTLAKSAAIDYGQYGPAYLRTTAKTCTALLTLLFKHYHRQLHTGITVTGVRISGNTAYALIGSTTFRPSFITAQQEGHGWKIAQLLGTENTLP